MKILYAFFGWPFSGSWGQHGSKILPKWCPVGWRKCSLLSGLEGLVGVLEPLGAQERIFTAFWVFFDEFLIDLWLFFDEFWLIYDVVKDDFSMSSVMFVIHV